MEQQDNIYTIGWNTFVAASGLSILLVLFMALMSSPGAINEYLGLIASLFAWLFTPVFISTLFFYYIKVQKGEKVTLDDVFIVRQYARLLLAYLLRNIIVVGGLFFFIFPGIYLYVAYSFTFYFIIDRDLPVWEAMEASRKSITPDWWNVFGHRLIMMFIQIAGFFALCLGLFVAIPVCAFALIALYDKIVGIHHLEESWSSSERFYVTNSGW